MPAYDLPAKIEHSYKGIPLKDPTAQVQILSAEELANLRRDKVLDSIVIAQSNGVREVSVTDRGNAEQQWRKGRDARNRGDLVAAITEYEAAIRQNPENSKYFNDLGVAYAIQNNEPAAVEAYKNAIRVREDFDPITYFNLAKSLKFWAREEVKRKNYSVAKRLFGDSLTNYRLFLEEEKQGRKDEIQTSINSLAAIERELKRL